MLSYYLQYDSRIFFFLIPWLSHIVDIQKGGKCSIGFIFNKISKQEINKMLSPILLLGRSP